MPSDTPTDEKLVGNYYKAPDGTHVAAVRRGDTSTNHDVAEALGVRTPEKCDSRAGEWVLRTWDGTIHVVHDDLFSRNFKRGGA
jgi:hypothetical protein